MRNNNIFISNNSIEAIYKNEKHLRHMLMPIIESIELTLKNHTLHEITRITIMGKIFDGDFKPIFIKERQKKLIEKLNNSLRIVYKDEDYNVANEEIFDWIHKIMIGNLFLLINSLRPKIKASIFKESFNVQIESNELKKELDKVREVRNRITHAEQLFFTKNSYLQTNKLNKTNYPIALKVNIKESFLNKILEPLVTFIDKYIRIFEKYKNN